MKIIDKLLNRITMYRLVASVLAVYAIAAVALSAAGLLNVASPATLVGSLLVVMSTTYLTELVYARAVRRPMNFESWLITSLIVFLIVAPAVDLRSGLALALGGIVASVSKLLIRWRGRHLFNPAAAAAAFLSITTLSAATWWVGSAALAPITLIGGLLIIRKTRRALLAATFVGVFALIVVLQSLMTQQAITIATFVSSPLIFLVSVMLTEPATMPSRRGHQLIFAVIVAVLAGSMWHIGPLVIYPEVALLIGNLYALAVSHNPGVRLKLAHVRQLSPSLVSYDFEPERPLTYLPGQYAQFTLPDVLYDARGNRRAFTVASSPTENLISVAMKIAAPASAFKARLAAMEEGDEMLLSQLAGDFTVDWEGSKPLCFVAGGIGVTPFRSMIRFAVDNRLRRDIVLIHVAATQQDLVYGRLFAAAAANGVRYVPIVGHGRRVLTAAMLRSYVPDAALRRFYLSGPQPMVDATARHVRSLGVPASSVVTDHFSGY